MHCEGNQQVAGWISGDFRRKIPHEHEIDI